MLHHTTIPSFADCMNTVKNVSENDVLSHRIYSKGCPTMIIVKLNLNSTTVHRIGIAATFGSVYVLVSVVMTIILAMIIIPKNCKELRVLLKAWILVIMTICELFKP